VLSFVFAYKINQKNYSKSFSLLSGVIDVPHTTHLVWTGKSGVQGSFWVLAQNSVVFASFNLVSWIKKALPVGPTGRYTRSQTHNSVLLSSLSNSVCRHKRNVLLLRNVAWYSLPVGSACNLLTKLNVFLTVHHDLTMY
jgi:hypothetical protein